MAGCAADVVLITTTVNADWNNWPTSPSFPPLMQELLYYASAARLREQVRTGRRTDRVVLAQHGRRHAEATISTPDGRTETVRTAGPRTRAASCAGPIPTSAASTASSSVIDPQQHLFAVNVPAINEAQQLSESDLTRTGREDLQKAYPEWELQVVTDSAR